MALHYSVRYPSAMHVLIGNVHLWARVSIYIDSHSNEKSRRLNSINDRIFSKWVMSLDFSFVNCLTDKVTSLTLPASWNTLLLFVCCMCIYSQDVLQNDAFKLDASFKQSLMIDMAKVNFHYVKKTWITFSLFISFKRIQSPLISSSS